MEHFKADSSFILEKIFNSSYTFEQLFDKKSGPKSQYKKVDYREYYKKLEPEQLDFARHYLMDDALAFGYDMVFWFRFGNKIW